MTPEQRSARAQTAATARWSGNIAKPSRPRSMRHRRPDDAYHSPEGSAYVDTGCQLRPRCLVCDLPMCVLDADGYELRELLSTPVPGEREALARVRARLVAAGVLD